MRICVIGNSHVAAIKAGWKAIEREHPGLDVTFFGAVSPLWDEIVFGEGELAAPPGKLRDALEYSSGGLSSIAADYDHYIICGMKLGAHVLTRFLETVPEDDMDDEAFIEDAKQAIRETLALAMVRKVQNITAAPVVLLPAPYHSEAAPADSYGLAISPEMASTLQRYYVAILADIGADDGFAVAHQPRSTIARALRTKAQYTEGADRLADLRSKTHHPSDYQHMNAEFGALCWAEMFPTLETV